MDFQTNEIIVHHMSLSTKKVKSFHEPALPPKLSIRDLISKTIFVFVIITIGTPYLIYLLCVHFHRIKTIIKRSKTPSIFLSEHSKDKILLERVWEADAGQNFCDCLEYQKSEGFCASASIRSILKSISFLNSVDLPEMRRGGSVPSR